MIKIIYKSIISLLILLLIVLVYLSTIGIKTDKFNSKLISQFKQIQPNIELKLNDVSATLDLFSFGINAKTIGTDLIYRDKIIKIETIKSKISLKSFFNNKFAITEISISTKSLAIKDLIIFARLVNNDPKLFIAENFIKKGYVVADLKLEFDEVGNIKKNYKFNGLFKDGKIGLLNKYDLNKIDFIFEIKEKTTRINDIKMIINNNNILMPELIVTKQNNEYLVSGKVNTNNTSFTKNEIENFIYDDFKKLEIQEILFNSKNNFEFKINKNFKVKNINIKSNIELEKLKLKNFIKLKKIFPKIKKDLVLKNQKLELKYSKDNLSILGSGETFLQNETDKIEYEIYKKKSEIKFKTKLKISKNSFRLDLLNYKKNKNSDLELNFVGQNNINGRLVFNEISLNEKDNFILIENLILSSDNKIDNLGNINFDYIDKEDLRNNLRLTKKKKQLFNFRK